MYLFDTDVLIWILRGNKQTIKKASQLKDKQPIAISVISIAEIFKNIFSSELNTTEKFLDSHVILQVTKQIAKQAGLYWQDYHPELKGLTLTDCLIAATVKENNASLVTLNTKHFPMKDIEILNPSK